MNREDLHIRDRLLMLAECSNPQKPFNIKRKSNVTKQSSKIGGGGGSGGGGGGTGIAVGGLNRMSMQDFVRMDPGYTPDIEHLVFPSRKRNPQQVAPINPTPAKTRSRLAEMFALSRHLQQRSADRETKSRSSNVNRSVDSVLDQPRVLPSNVAAPLKTPRQWTVVEEPVRQTTGGSARVSPAVESDMATTRGPNVSVLHLRSTSEPWETSPTSAFVVSTGGSSGRSAYSSAGRTATAPPPVQSSSSLTKQQSLNAQYKWNSGSSSVGGGGGSGIVIGSINSGNNNGAGFHSGGEVNSTEIFLAGGSCSREISPVRWCDREVDGVYLGKSGWVQVQQRSLDENRRSNYNANVPYTATSSSVSSARRPGIKLSDYHFNSEPERKCMDMNRSIEAQRPIYLPIQSREYERKAKTPPSPCRNVPRSFSPPNITPIISPPPAFQDKAGSGSSNKSRTFFGKAPFLPRSDAIVDSDASPETSPKTIRKPIVITPVHRKPKPSTPTTAPLTNIEHNRTYPRIPQTKSLEDTTSNRRNQFLQKYGESSSSSSSSMGFRSLDSYVARPAMPRLSENTDSSAEVYEDADDEDNNSSSLNLSMQILPLMIEQQRNREKISPTNRRTASHHRTPPRRSPAGSDSNRHQSSSSSSSCDEFLNPNQSRRNKYQTIKSPQQEDAAALKVRRSKSLQLPDKKVVAPTSFKENIGGVVHQRLSPQQRENVHPRLSPQHADNQQLRSSNKLLAAKKHNVKMPDGDALDEDMLREAEVVAGYLYGNRNRAVAQAHLIHRYNNSGREEKAKEYAKSSQQNNLFNVYYIGKNSNAAVASAVNSNSNNKEQQQQQQRHKMLQRGLTMATASMQQQSKPQSVANTSCNHDTCDFWPHCASRESLNATSTSMRLSQSYPSHQKPLESPIEAIRPNSIALERARDAHKKRATMNRSETDPKAAGRRPNLLCDDLQEADNRKRIERRPSPSRVACGGSLPEKRSPMNRYANVTSSTSSSSSEVYVTTSDRTSATSKSPKNAKSCSGASTPLDSDVACVAGAKNGVKCRDETVIISRPGSAPNEDNDKTVAIENQQRSMSLPKSFLSASHQPR